MSNNDNKDNDNDKLLILKGSYGKNEEMKAKAMNVEKRCIAIIREEMPDCCFAILIGRTEVELMIACGKMMEAMNGANN